MDKQCDRVTALLHKRRRMLSYSYPVSSPAPISTVHHGTGRMGYSRQVVLVMVQPHRGHSDPVEDIQVVPQLEQVLVHPLQEVQVEAPATASDVDADIADPSAHLNAQDDWGNRGSEKNSFQTRR